MKKQKKYFTSNNQGFTLVELLIVIAIIGILSSVVLVSTQGAVLKAKRTSAMTTLASVLPELVTCADDAGVAKSGTPVANDPICCTNTSCTALLPGHTVRWPAIYAKTGWDYGAIVVGTTIAAGDYTYTAVKTGEATIQCNMATNECI